MSIKALITLISLFPEIIRLLKAIEAAQINAEKKKLEKKDLEKITQAFKEQDAEALRAIFNNSGSK